MKYGCGWKKLAAVNWTKAEESLSEVVLFPGEVETLAKEQPLRGIGKAKATLEKGKALPGMKSGRRTFFLWKDPVKNSEVE